MSLTKLTPISSQPSTTHSSLYTLLSSSTSINDSQNSDRHHTLTPHDINYLNELLHYSASRVDKEPHYLNQSLVKIHNDINTLLYTHYHIFIESHESLYNSMNICKEMKTHNDNTRKHIPSLNDTINNLIEFTNENFLTKKLQFQRIVENESIFTELLEFPTLLKQCIKNELYDESLDLLHYIQILYRRYHTDHTIHENNHHNDVIQHIYSAMKLYEHDMIHQLMDTLYHPLTLNNALRIIGYLRRLKYHDHSNENHSNHSELELKKLFLQARLQWFSETLNSLIIHPHTKHTDNHIHMNSTDAYNYLLKYIDMNRIHLFDIITQYNAIFASDDNDAEGDENNDVNRQKSTADSDILSYWCHERIQSLLHTISLYLPCITDGSYILHIINHTLYCSISLSRIGLDFSLLCIPLFESSILGRFSNDMSDALRIWSDSLDAYEWYIPKSTLQKIGMSLITFQHHTSTPKQQENDTKGTGNESYNVDELIEYPPLAILLNHIIHTFNRLRHCALQTIKYKILEILNTLIVNIAKRIVELDSVLPSIDDDELMNDIIYSSSHSASSSATSAHRRMGTADSNSGDNKSKVSGRDSTGVNKLSLLARAYCTIFLPYVQELLVTIYNDDTLKLDLDVCREMLRSIYIPASSLSNDASLQKPVSLPLQPSTSSSSSVPPADDKKNNDDMGTDKKSLKIDNDNDITTPTHASADSDGTA